MTTEEQSTSLSSNHNSSDLINGEYNNNIRMEQGDSEVEKMTPYQHLTHDMANDQRFMREITLGKRIGFYRIRHELGSGNFSKVRMGIHSLTKERVAIKILDKTKLDQKTQRLLSREIGSMERLHHPNIIRLYEVVETLAKLYIVMEYAAGGELFAKISNEGKLTEVEASVLFAQVIAAVSHMHSKNIIHRDLKAENVFYANEGWVKVGDFGFSTSCKPNETLNTFCGSPPYAAPELFKDEHYVGPFVDIWALGIMVYFMVTGVMPFRADTVAKLKKCILDGTYTIPTYVSSSCQNLIQGILKHSPTDRLSIDQIKKSNWLKSQDFPRAHDEIKLVPDFTQQSSSKAEMEVLSSLKDYGITQEHFKEIRDKEARSNIAGTYRIILHKAQKKHTEAPSNAITQQRQKEREAKEKGGGGFGRGRRRSSASTKVTVKSSKFCTIL